MLTLSMAGNAWAESPAGDSGGGDVIQTGTMAAGDEQAPQTMPLTGGPILANENIWLAANIVVLVFLLGGVIWQLSRGRPL